jgi:hypothetical protein
VTRSEQKKSLSSLQLRICHLAIAGNKPSVIRGLLPNVADATISNAIQRGRAIGLAIPKFSTAVRGPRIHPPEVQPTVPVLSLCDRDRLADLASRNIGITAIATILRKPYRLIAEELDRAGLSRRGVG